MAGMPEGRLEEPGIVIPEQDAPRHRRGPITAESFRLLTARLMAGKFHAHPAVDALPAVLPDLAIWSEAAPALQEPIPEPRDPAAELPVEIANHVDAVLPDFAPLWPLEGQVHTEVAEETLDTLDDGFQEPEESPVSPQDFEKPIAAAPFMEAEGEQDAAEVVENAPQAEPDPQPSFEISVPDPKPAMPLPERIAGAMLQTVTEAIYAKPTAEERAAFLREVAALMEPAEDSAEMPEPAAPLPEPLPDLSDEPLAEPEEPEDIPATLADKFGPSTAILLKQPEAAPDLFSKTAKDAIRLAPKPDGTVEPDPDSGELALSLLDMMSAGAASGLPQERALAADTLLRMVPRVPEKQLIVVVERVAIMEAPPSLLVAKLIRDPRPDVVAPLLERCM
ncbi:MAG: hypothetical protein ACREDU_03755, partial [Methylocella sp.]